MTERVQEYRLNRAGTSPEAWVKEGSGRRASIWRVSDRAALEESAQYDINVTHHATVDYKADAYEAVGSGVRRLDRTSDGQKFWIVRAVEVGKRGRRGRHRYMRLSLSQYDASEV